MSMDTPAWNQGAELPPPKKSGSKTWLILGVVLGICVLICCGGGVILIGLVARDAATMLSNEPAVVTAAQQSIVEIQVPTELPPLFKIDAKIPLVNQRQALIVYFGTQGDDNLLWLGEAGQLAQQAGDVESQVELVMLQHSQTAKAGNFKQLVATSQRDVQVTANGKPATLQIVEGTDSSGKTFVQASGTFTGKNGDALIKLQVDAEKQSVEQVEGILKSMK